MYCAANIILSQHFRLQKYNYTNYSEYRPNVIVKQIILGNL